MDRIDSPGGHSDAAIRTLSRSLQFQDALLAAAKTLLCRTGMVPADRHDLARLGGQRITLHLQRCHWLTQVWVDDQQWAPKTVWCTASVRPDHATLARQTYLDHPCRQSREHQRRSQFAQCDRSHPDQLERDHRGHRIAHGSPVCIADVQVFPDIETRVDRVYVRVNNHSAAAANVQLSLSAWQSEQAVAAASTPLLVEGSSAAGSVTTADRA